MRYIRFLKYPRCSYPRKQDSSTITALITITSDLGESFCSKDVTIAANLVRDKDGESMGYKVHQWRAGMRNLLVDVNVGDITAYPMKLHIAAKYQNGDDSCEYLSNAGNYIVSAWSETLCLLGKSTIECMVERRDAGLILMSFLDAGITAGAIDVASLRETLATAKQRRLNCIELGTGCGIVGLGLAQALPNCDMLLTDLPEAMDVVKRNMLSARPAPNTTINFEVLDWGKDLPTTISSKEFDLILVADCTYNPSSMPSLVCVLATLARRSPGAMVLLAQKVRHSSEAIFFEHIAESGFIQNDHVAIPLPSDEELGFSDDSENVDIYIFQTRNSGDSLRI
ncbi:hypothetical protein FGG08_003350 [Glutinoglossum americanum]|uniref:Uncharacterized protein n=1 Tax=Glutinoglossum americanum TaxID=1670608 RepID=A0A9P8I7C6_9PEZI|nr:hypothetical protein FGG08_003350 [Glutinoglossum americanum]